MDAYFEDLHVAGMRVDEALRAFVGSFRLSGEAGPINYMMEKFSSLYVSMLMFPFVKLVYSSQPYPCHIIFWVQQQVQRAKSWSVWRKPWRNPHYGLRDPDAEHKFAQSKCSSQRPDDNQRLPGTVEGAELVERNAYWNLPQHQITTFYPYVGANRRTFAGVPWVGFAIVFVFRRVWFLGVFLGNPSPTMV